MWELKENRKLEDFVRLLIVIGVCSLLLMITIFISSVSAASVDTGVHAYSYRGDSKIKLALVNNSLIYNNLVMDLYSSSPGAYNIYIDGEYIKGGDIDFHQNVKFNTTKKGFIDLDVVICNNSHHYHVYVLHRSYKSYLEAAEMVGEYTYGELIAYALSVFAACFVGVFLSFGIIALYRIPRIKREVRRLL